MVGGKDPDDVLREFAEVPGVVFEEHIANRLPQVPEKSIGNLDAIDDAAGVDGEVAVQIVAAAFAEFLAHARRPVL